MRNLIFVSFVIVALTLSAIFGFAKYSDRATHNHPQQSDRIVDGSKTPELIPDHAAQEVFLRSLVARPDEGEAGQRRVRAFAEETGLKGTEVDALLALAQNFVARVSALDNQVKGIKDEHWPQPSESAKAQLVQLQENKRWIIVDTITSLATRLGSGVSVGKVQRYIIESVKRQMSSFTPPPLTHKQGKLKGNKQGVFGLIFGFVGSSSFTTLAAAPIVQLMGEGYTYSNASHNIGASEGYTYGATVEDYSSYGHEYRITVTAWLGSTNAGSSTYPAAPDYYSPPISTSRTVSLILGNGTPFEGFLSTTTSGGGFCPVSYVTFGTSSSQAQSQVGPTVRISAVTFDPTTIPRQSGSTTLSVQISASTAVPANTTVNVEAYQNTNSGPDGPATLTISPTNGQNSTTVGSGSPGTVTFTIVTPSTNVRSATVTYATRTLQVSPPTGYTGPAISIGMAQNNGISNNLTVQ